MMEFFAMNGYGFYIWMSFGLTFLILAYNIIQPILQHQQAMKEADDLHTDTEDNA